MATSMNARRGEAGSTRRFAAWAIGTALVLAVPLVAMQFTDEVAWDVADFVVMGALLFGAGAAYEVVSRQSRRAAYRAGLGVALATAFVLVWVNGAVGLIGNENNDANLMFGGVLAIGVIGSVVARFQPEGMARTLFAIAIAQVLVGAVALVGGLGSTGPTWPRDIVMLTGFFTALWLFSAWLFRAAREPARGGHTVLS